MESFMKNKELKQLAKKIADLETTIQTVSDKEAIKKAQNEIMKLSGRIESFEELARLDELVQEELFTKKNIKDNKGE